tara:strand:+ start:398 stop:616 length:219 start_codon:yes stop_codon:yes gene_type:complete
MKIIQTKDGGGELIFSDEEIKILQKRKKLIFTPEGFTRFGNNLARVLMEFAMKTPDGIKNILTSEKDKYEGK